MIEFADQFFVLLKGWALDLLAAWLPAAWRPGVSAALSVGAILAVFGLLFGLVTVIERKLLGRIQNRYGPNRVGPFGFLQFAADGIKTLTKEDVVTGATDRVVHFLAPLVLVAPVLMTYAVLPFGRNLVALDFEAGLLFFFAMGAATELSLFMAGWSSRNKYSLLGAMRAIAQMLAYEVPLILSTVGVVMRCGSLSLVAIVEHQAGAGGAGFWHWHLCTPWGLAGFLVFLIAATAESNRSPFDLPEGESEIIAGYYLEYSGFKFALFFLGEYLGLFAACGLAITLFLGGWHAPLPFLAGVPSYCWFFAKLMVLVFLMIWVRGTLPRLRVDQLTTLAWKFLLPLALINLVAAGIWHLLGPGLVRWVAGLLLVALPFVGLGRALNPRKEIKPRSYRFAN